MFAIIWVLEYEARLCIARLSLTIRKSKRKLHLIKAETYLSRVRGTFLGHRGALRWY